jgi:hypothetical protein
MTPGSRARAWAAVAGAAVVLAYFGGAVLSGRHSPLARRPLLDGLAPPPPYHWVKPPPELAPTNKPPASARQTVRLTSAGSEVSAIATGDGQASLVLEANAFAPSPGATGVAVAMDPLDPSSLAPAPAGLVLAGNAYRMRFTYQPSGKPAPISGKATAVLIYPLLPIPVGSLFDYTMLSSPDGKAWERQQSTATPGSHQLAAPLKTPGYLIVAVPPAPAEAPAPNRVPLIAGLAAAAVVIIAGAVVLTRRLRRSGYEDEEYDEDDWDEDEDDPDRGAKEGR